MNLRDGTIRGPSFLVLLFLEGPPPVVAVLLTDDDDLDSKIDEPKEVSGAPNDRGTLCDLSGGCPTAPS